MVVFLLLSSLSSIAESLSLSEPEAYRYLNQSGCVTDQNLNDVEMFSKVMVSPVWTYGHKVMGEMCCLVWISQAEFICPKPIFDVWWVWNLAAYGEKKKGLKSGFRVQKQQNLGNSQGWII